MIYLFLFILGISVGSFLNVLIDRLPQGQSINGRSHCDHCRHQLAWYDLIPIVSFFLLKRKCRYCGKKISWQYPLIEILTGAIFVGIWNFEFGILNGNYSIFNILNSIFLFIVGSAIGSFLNVLIDRLPKGEKITGRSCCDHCKHKLSWQDLIPIISFFLLRGKCRYCSKNISWQYPLVELITGVLFIGIWNFEFGILNGNYSIFNILNSIFLLGIVSSLIVIFFSDLKYQIIPDWMQIFLFIFSVMLNLFQHPYYEILKRVQDDIISGAIVMLPILLLYLLTKSRGMGFGDVKLAFTIGFLLGIKAGFLALYFGFVLGGIVGLILLLLKKKKLKSKIAFGPFLVIGLIVMLFFGDKVWSLISRIYRF